MIESIVHRAVELTDLEFLIRNGAYKELHMNRLTVHPSDRHAPISPGALVNLQNGRVRGTMNFYYPPSDEIMIRSLLQSSARTVSSYSMADVILYKVGTISLLVLGDRLVYTEGTHGCIHKMLHALDSGRIIFARKVPAIVRDFDIRKSGTGQEFHMGLETADAFYYCVSEEKILLSIGEEIFITRIGNEMLILSEDWMIHLSSGDTNCTCDEMVNGNQLCHTHYHCIH